MNETAKTLINDFTFARVEERINSKHAVYPRIIYEKDGKEYYFDASCFCFNLQELKEEPTSDNMTASDIAIRIDNANAASEKISKEIFGSAITELAKNIRMSFDKEDEDE